MKNRYTKSICLTAILISTNIFYSNAQNLVPNPGFETQTSCPGTSQITVAPPWNSPSLNTPDLMNDTCTFQNFPGRSGHGCAGIYTYNSFLNNREYIQAPLTTPMVAGHLYHVSFYVKYSNFT